MKKLAILPYTFSFTILIISLNFQITYQKNGAYVEEKLVAKNPTADSIILENEGYSLSHALVRNFPNEVLAYVTPWNNHGYDIAKMYGKKFTILSPVWLQIKPSDKKWTITGQHDIDSGWMDDVRKVNPDIKFFPRLIFEGLASPHLKALNKIENLKKIGKPLINLAKKHRFNGYVIEIWNSYAGKNKNDLRNIVINLAATLKDAELDMILVIPPPFYVQTHTGKRFRTEFQADDLNVIGPHIKAFSLMTYDNSVSSGSVGPNSPLQWIANCLDELDPDLKYRSKILTGLNMYGYKYTFTGPLPILGSEYLKLLQENKPEIIWDNIYKEHYFILKGDDIKTIYYPTLYSIQKRLELAQKMHTGISLWEIGQGLDYFYNLL